MKSLVCFTFALLLSPYARGADSPATNFDMIEMSFALDDLQAVDEFLIARWEIGAVYSRRVVGSEVLRVELEDPACFLKTLSTMAWDKTVIRVRSYLQVLPATVVVPRTRPEKAILRKRLILFVDYVPNAFFNRLGLTVRGAHLVHVTECVLKSPVPNNIPMK